MIVIVKSAPDTADGQRGVALAKHMAADLVLLQNGVYYAQKGRLGEFPLSVYVLDDDTRLRGLKDTDMEKSMKSIDYGAFVDLMTGSDNVVGMF